MIGATGGSMAMRRRDFIAGTAALPLASRLAHAQTPTPRRGGTMTIVLQPEPPMLMLGINQAAPAPVPAGKIYQSLLTYDFNLNPLPSLATSWTRSDDGLTYTFKLAENVKWHDGRPFTSADVVFTTQVFLTEVHPRARANFARVDAVTTPDPHTVVYRLKEPLGPFLPCFEVYSCPIVPKAVYY